MNASPKLVSKATSSFEKDHHIFGLRGILAISSFLWIFFETFIPAVATHSTAGPGYQRVLRIVFGTVLWDESLISSFFFVLSARAICVRFLKDPTADKFAGAIIRRSIRLVVASGAALFITYGIFAGLGTKYIATFKQTLPNHSINSPGVPKTALQGFNAVFDMFWVVRQYDSQAANAFWPTSTLGRVSLLYNQSWTVYFLMVLLPFGRPQWHVQVLALFTIGAFWMCSWGWYSACALLIADVTINPSLASKLASGLTLSEKRNWKVHYPLIGFLMIPIGLAMKYVWAVFPRYIDGELVLHPYLDLSEQTTRRQFAAADPYPRVDDFFVIFGLLLIVETMPKARNVLSGPWLVSLGRRSFSLFVAQSLLMWSAGIKLWIHLHMANGTSVALANLAVFITTLVAVILFGEAFYRVVDVPSQWLATAGYYWVTS
ncbi:hypothetical protein M409DRAFT_66625 [Zasmidium cellare ATCC 36951]|uniref:Acyltransferase 3 domain-containing protein n=1 Tax=Zasmidium cellare ATCC 36951 TaxID=1080233 RepID=A0A6A6CHB9_ZASCE|nr:uncharacterized protein M409DRAFT_66625 [Zasmidium cellare ATCC 36951]KAF2166637.1 hypothetical protein M409DRAFT_66625 [Zasmidium cellare ATCC 36951]